MEALYLKVATRLGALLGRQACSSVQEANVQKSELHVYLYTWGDISKADPMCPTMGSAFSRKPLYAESRYSVD